MKDNSEIVDATLQAVDDIQTNIQTYVTDKIDPAPTVESGLRQGLMLGMLATETTIEADDEAESEPESPGQVQPDQFGDFDNNREDVVAPTQTQGVMLAPENFPGVTSDDVEVTPDVAPVASSETGVEMLKLDPEVKE